uniref:GTP-binding protein 10 n=1 Tax=Plectus sambesii TaxID=2011161 RepID=A0A914VVC3_9BILA
MTVVAIDRFRFNVKAGAGGNGLARYNGVGGDGGNIYLHARNDVQFKRLLKQLDNADLQRMRAEVGAAATQTKLIGKRGQDTVFKVPTGVEVINADTDTVIVRCNTHDKRYLLAKGGEGGKSTNNFVGQLGEQFNIILSLKLRVDVGLIGFPNAGKSTLLKALTPKKKIHIANYPFTTTKPQVCYLKYDQDVGDDGLFAMSIADLPGLIEGAHLNRGKGHKFLKHVENASIIIFVVDATGFRLSEDSTYRTAAETVGLLNRELELYDSSLLQKPIVLCINKTDLPNSEEKAAAVEEMLREKDWPKLLPEDCRPQNPIVFRSILKTAARDFRLNGLQELLREVYFELNPMASDDYDFFEPRSKKHLT